jgi:hypothetical protein
MESQALTGEINSRRSDGGVYLVVADNTEEFPVALRYACRLAHANRGHVAIFYVTEISDFQHWGNVESRMKQELRAEAEKLVWSVAQKANDLNGMIPAIYLAEGERISALQDTISNDMTIRALILAASPGASPGPLVAHFSGKGISKLRVPLFIVPGHLDPQKIDDIT